MYVVKPFKREARNKGTETYGSHKEKRRYHTWRKRE